ncbi:MAG: PT domain-containing protein [Acutalibacteraceae bacterium]|nr:PT domain-containing protein [Acutalibacteraceae bacterium]
MLKRLGRKFLPILMASMLVTSMTAVSATAVEVSEENTVVSGETTTSTYVDEFTGIKLESDSVTLEESDMLLNSMSAEDFPMFSNVMEKNFDITVLGDEHDDETGIYVNFAKTPVTAYLPCANEGRYVAFINSETMEVKQVEAEYADGFYKIQLVGHGSYVICDYPLAEGEGEMTQQTLYDETTGITVSGMLQSDSKLLVIDVVQLATDILGALGDLGSMEGMEGMEDIDIDIEDESMQQVLDILNSFDGYLVCPMRNFNIAKTEGDMKITLPCEFSDYEVRNMDIFSEDIQNGDFSSFEQYAGILSEDAFETKTNEQIAEDVNGLIDTLLTKLTAEFVEGNYIVNSDSLGLFVVAKEGTFKVTADHIQMLREEYEASKQETPTEPSTEAPTQSTTEAPTQQATQAPTQSTTQAPTQAATKAPATTSGKVANTGDSRNIPAMLMVLGLATATITALRKKGMVK